jgi:ATP-binding cassette, subfamily C (CFTR/MRP), member 1
MACKDPHGEQWGPVSRLRDFDLTPCFEEGFLLPGLLAVYIFLQLFRILVLNSQFENLERSRKSVWVLRAKLVRQSLFCADVTHFRNLTYSCLYLFVDPCVTRLY